MYSIFSTQGKLYVSVRNSIEKGKVRGATQLLGTWQHIYHFCRLIVSKLCLEKVKFSFTHYLCVIQCACLLFPFLEQLYFQTNFDERLPLHTS